MLPPRPAAERAAPKRQGWCPPGYPPKGPPKLPPRRQSQRGSTMVEFAVVGPLITLLGTVILQYALMFNAKNVVNHAGFMAAREGSMSNSEIDKIRVAYAKALIPLYGGGTDVSRLAESYGKAQADTLAFTRIELLNPTKESFDDWEDKGLKAAVGNAFGGRRILNHAKSQYASDQIKANSGQNERDANLIKLRITHGYELKVPLAGSLMQFMMRWNDDASDPYMSMLYQQRRVPLVTHVTLAMQSDAVEQSVTLSNPGMGNNGQPQDPAANNSEGQGNTPAVVTRAPPNCVTVGCTVIRSSGNPSLGLPGLSGIGGTGGGSPGTGGNTPSNNTGSSGDLYSCKPGDPDCTLICKGS